MSFLTNRLIGEVGIQYSDIVSEEITVPKQTNILMLVEDIPRGRTDKPMLITTGNVHQKLGRMAGNQYLQAVYDALETNVPQVSVLRIVSEQQAEIHEILYNNTIRYDGQYDYNN